MIPSIGVRPTVEDAGRVLLEVHLFDMSQNLYGKLVRVEDFRERYIADIVSKAKLTRPIKVVAACGNGTAGAFAPEALRRMGAEVIEMDTDLDYTFPKYNPNPEDHAMLVQMAQRVRETGADLALGFDGDGDRIGVVLDATGLDESQMPGLVEGTDQAGKLRAELAAVRAHAADDDAARLPETGSGASALVGAEALSSGRRSSDRSVRG